jgi:hypothetical protein
MNPNILIEEYHIVGGITADEFHTYLADFTNFSSDYDDPFETNFRAKITAATAIATASFYISELKQLGEAILVHVNLIYKRLNLLDRYLFKAKDELTVSPRNFNLKVIRRAGRNGNFDLLGTELVNLFLKLDLNSAALINHGMPATFIQDFKDIADKISKNNKKQELYKSTKAVALEANHVLFDDLYAVIRDVQETGKALFKEVSQAKVDAFTMAVVLRRLRHQTGVGVGMTDIYVDVENIAGHSLEGMKVTMIEFNMTKETEADGKVVFQQISNEVIKMVSFKIEGPGFETQITGNKTLVPNEDMNVDIIMEALP